MDIFEKMNRAFGTWYEGLFGGDDDVRPKDILRRIITALEDNRKEGVDDKIYVPNQYILEISVEDEEEKDYLLSFLDKDELEAAIRRYCQQNRYNIRGALDFTIKELGETDPDTPRRSEKVIVRCRYNARVTAPTRSNPRRPTPAELPAEERTVASVHVSTEAGEDSGAGRSASVAGIVVYAPDRPPFRFPITRSGVSIGRSQRADNDIVLDSDGQVSKRHARIEMDADGRFTVYDLDSTNGTKVNGRRISNRTLHDGDEIVVGTTRLMFQQTSADATYVMAPAPVDGSTNRPQPIFGGAAAQWRNADEIAAVGDGERRQTHRARLVLLQDGQEVDGFLLASECTVGRAVTNDIVLPDRSVATRHARLFNDGDGYRVECLDPQADIRVNGEIVEYGALARLNNGDRLGLGNLRLRFDSSD